MNIWYKHAVQEIFFVIHSIHMSCHWVKETKIPCSIWNNQMLCYLSFTKLKLFNGDFVDRGSFSCEVIFTLFSFKLLYPDHFFMSRGKSWNFIFSTPITLNIGQGGIICLCIVDNFDILCKKGSDFNHLFEFSFLI